ncbi:glycosyltransferase [Vulcanococcus limneticus Candia 3F8]|uniref:glycosyltransferase n=1 Tax=Vulcanococcus limneticus TaxID=2170428 RepID=UPI000B991F99|nr:glycosyltransferase [Vulcanococcus limneticus]MCP9791135.1 glycosyltransferase [Vulcanococcus limneticus MW73D5]MCP9893715.1 glycosyltransferase [Vulcanococcus limneticus Candia 3F8]MCP9896533.1 glycosyltransferase [Vulcanococcus limneticus Candia 3B3]
MKVLHVNAFDGGGGAARAAMRLHQGLRAYGVDSLFASVKSGVGGPGVVSPLGQGRQVVALVKRQVALRIARLQKTPANPIIHSLGLFTSGLGAWINASDVDIVNLHWVCAETLSLGEIARIEKPIVWTMHDMWAFMGAEHYDDGDHPGRWKAPYSAANRPPGTTGPDLDAWVWARKARLWSGKTFNLVAPSTWLANCARESALMGNQPCEVIHNPLDTTAFAPIDRNVARELLGLPQDRKFILFGALGATSDRRKGYDLLVEALRSFERDHDAGGVDVMVFGGQSSGEIPGVALPCHFLGTFADEISLRLVYSAADIFVAPSRQDNLPNTVVEASACGVPTVAFDIGGMSDIVTDGETGALVAPFDTNALAAGMARLLRAPIAQATVRAHAEAKFSPAAALPAYIALYQRLAAGG